MALLNFNADAPIPTQSPSESISPIQPQAVPGSPLDNFLTRVQSNLTTQADAEPVTTCQTIPNPTQTQTLNYGQAPTKDKPFSFWPEDTNVVNEKALPVSPIATNPAFQPPIDFKPQIETQTEFETPVKRTVGRPRLEMHEEIKEQEERVRSLYANYLQLCQDRKAAAMAYDKNVAAALAEHSDAKSTLRAMKRDAC